MKIAVLVKEVADLEAQVRIEDGGKTLEVEPKRVVNFFDEIAIEAALQLKQAHGGEICAISAGSGSGTEALRRSLAMGVDSILLVDDPALEGCGALTTAKALAATIAGKGYDLILAGKQSTDEEAGLVGMMIAELLGIPCIGGAVSLAVGDGKVTVGTESEQGNKTLHTALPALVTAEKGLYEPRVPQVMGLMRAMKAEIPRVDLAGLGVEVPQSPQLVGYSLPSPRPAVKMIEGGGAELIRVLREEAKAI